MDRLGPSPAVVTGEGGGVVARGNGLVAKAGSAAEIAREVLVMHEAIAALPLAVPGLVECGETWVVEEDVPDTEESWTAADVAGALADLAGLHTALLNAEWLHDPRLADPLGPSLDAALQPARATAGLDAILPGAAAVALDPSPLLNALGALPPTLLHGDPWPANVRRPAPGHRVWVDWAGAARGPSALDVATWLDQTPWVVDDPHDPSAEVQLDAYVAAAEPADEPGFRRAVDAATVLWFLLVDVARLPGIRHAPETVERLLAPKRAALARLSPS